VAPRAWRRQPTVGWWKGGGPAGGGALPPPRYALHRPTTPRSEWPLERAREKLGPSAQYGRCVAYVRGLEAAAESAVPPDPPHGPASWAKELYLALAPQPKSSAIRTRAPWRRAP
jgi:hypothetical protein